MGKKKGNQTSSLGKGIIKERSKNSKSSKVYDSWLHTSELNDGYDWNRINLRSVTEQSNLDDFLTTAELAGTEFTAERLNVKVIDPGQHTGLPTAAETIAITEAQKENIQCLQIPRRPKWDSSTTAEQLNQREKDSFLEWRRQLAVLQEKEHIVLTPFERNLDFWRQLWRVIERSDVIVQIVDARNPLLFRCTDLEKYVKEVSENKENVILISKADLLTSTQRQAWADYFSEQGIRVAFWSAVMETERLEKKEAELTGNVTAEGNDESGDEDNEDDDDDGGNYEEEEEEEDVDDDNEQEEDEGGEATAGEGSTASLTRLADDLNISSNNRPSEPRTRAESSETLPSCGAIGGGDAEQQHGGYSDVDASLLSRDNERDTTSDDHGSESTSARTIPPVGESCQSNSQTESSNVYDGGDNTSRAGGSVEASREGSQIDPTQSLTLSPVSNASHLLTGEELLEFLKEIHAGRPKVNDAMTTIGMVGYPNVGKSSTINALLREKKVPVSATPGRTKHFQTLFVEPTLCLCDCPGLVMPSFVTTKADMYLNGILPIDQMRDFTAPVSLLCARMPREVLELTYGMNLIKPQAGEDPDRPPTALEFLNAHAYVRGFMTHKGVPDCFRSARIVLKDYVNGKLLYRVPPPDVSPEEFESIHFPSEEVGEVKAGSRPKKSANKPMITEGGQTVKKSPEKKVDESFFSKPSVAHTKALPPGRGMAGVQPAPGMAGVGVMGKPWKKQKRGKKEKLRRVYGHLDEK
ncbi:large subunit GTPase 1 homolog [Diadema setosum]|uniref:large subunit GTPase 1 homolog n=1 Tax=Diadema setosum TaxID=31175 RepID=UPI003B3AF3A3